MTDRPIPHLPRSFYADSAILRKVEQAGFSRITSPDAVLACVIARVAASLDPGIKLPGNTSLNFVAAVVGKSGTGKSQAFSAARDLLPNIGTPVDGWNIGSGEGIVAAIVGKVDPETGLCPIQNPRVLFCVDEGEQLLKVGKRDSSITLPTIRSAWAGQGLGQTNASRDTTRNAPPHSYRFAMYVGLQPTFAAQLLTGDGAGDPQRYLFAAVQNPEQPEVLPSFPEPLEQLPYPVPCSLEVAVDSEVQRIVDDRRIRKQRGETAVDTQDSHRDLVTLKVAALLALLHNSDLTPYWWNKASAVVENSCRVRQWLIDTEQASLQDTLTMKATNEAELRLKVDGVQRSSTLDSMLQSMVNKLKLEGRQLTASDLANATASKHRSLVPAGDAITEGLNRGLFVKLDDKTPRYTLPNRN
jgi:hypothetical protein